MQDVLKDKFQETLKKIHAINAPVSLVESGVLKSEFEANGKKYIIMPPDLVFNIERQVHYSNIELAFALNQTPIEIKQKFLEFYQTQMRMIRPPQGTTHESLVQKLWEDSYNNLQSFKGSLTSRYPAAYYICTLFIIREGEDLAAWSFELADEKINDWCKANLRAADFFGIALSFSKECQTIIEGE